MGILLLLIVLFLLFGLGGFALHILWVAAVIVGIIVVARWLMGRSPRV
jgi:hypothetical protein